MTYTTRPARLGIHTLALLFPVWGILLPTMLALFILLLLRLPADIPLVYSLGLVGGMVSVFALCLSCALICDDDKIHVSKDGITFPLRFLPTLKWRRQFKWEELGAIKLNWQRGESFAPDDAVTFFFFKNRFFCDFSDPNKFGHCQA